MQAKTIRRVAMDLLARREHSRLELQRKLSLRDFPLIQITPVLDQLEKDNLLSNKRFSEAYVRMRSRRGFGPVRIHQELLERGIEAEMSTAALQLAPIDWGQLANTVYLKKYATQSATDYTLLAKQRRFLSYRGFSHQQINQALGEHHEI